MTEPKFTPAPWSVSFYTGAIESGEKVVATVNYSISEGNPDINANLIAAAPELYEALKDLLFVADVPIFRAAHPESLQKARAAIAKARGESNA